MYDSYKNGEIKLFKYKSSNKIRSDVNLYDDAANKVNRFYGTNI